MDLDEILKHTRQSLSLTQKQMADKLKISQQVYHLYENGARKPGVVFYKKWREVFGTDLIDLADTVNKQPELSGDTPVKFFHLSALLKKDTWPGVPMYDIPVTAGAVESIRDESLMSPAFYLPIPSFKGCTFGARVSGDSMYPEIRNGDYVVCKEVMSMDSLIYGDIYLVITHDGMETVKYLHPHDDEDWVKLVPYNKSVPPTPMPKKNIRSVYKVKGVLKGY